MKNVRIHFDKHNLFEVALVGLVVFALWQIRDFLVVLGVGLIVSTFIEDFVVRAEKIKIPRVVSVVAFYVLTFIIFAGVIVYLIPVISNEIGSLAQIYPELESVVGLNSIFNQSLSDLSPQGIIEIFQDTTIREQFSQQALAVFGGVFNLVVIFIVSFYLSIQKDSIDHMLRIFTPLKYEELVISIWHRVQRKVGSWFRGQLVIALILVVLTYLGLSFMGLPYAFLLSVLAGLFGLVPYGIFIAILPTIGIALSYGGGWMALYVIIFYFVLQQILDLALQPIIVKKLTGIPSLMVILSITIGAKLFGVYGLFLAIPLALFVMEIIAESEKYKASQRDPLIETDDDDIVVIIDR